MTDSKTTWLGNSGEVLTTTAMAAPFPANVGLAVAGLLLKGAAWYFAKDRDLPRKEPAFHVDKTQ